MNDSHPCAFYACIGSELMIFSVDAENKALARIGSVQLPAQIQYGWQHPVQPFFYIASSSGYVSSSDPGAGAAVGKHYVNAFSLDRATGLLAALGDPVALPSRPIHMSVDRTGDYVLAAHPHPPAITVFKLNPDGTIGSEVKHTPDLDFGIYPHQIMVTPSNRTVILVTRGNDAQNGKPEDPGALKVYDFKNGVLSNKASVALKGGYGYGPRHLDFHPVRPWVYVSFERENELHMYDLLDDGGLAPQPRYVKSTLSVRSEGPYKQGAGAIHIHPDGKTVYVSNRSSAKPDADGKRIHRGGENDIAVFTIDGDSGEPTLAQSVETQALHPRTFAVDPSGRMLLSASLVEVLVAKGDSLEAVSAGISTLGIGADGKLTFVRKYALDTSQHTLWWSGVVKLG